MGKTINAIFNFSGKRAMVTTVLVALFAAPALTARANCADIQPTRPGEVYFMRGLANIFSLGLDAFAAEVSGLGIRNCVFNHSRWKVLVDEIIERDRRGQLSKPLMIIGHSLGANIAPAMATSIGRAGIPVSYVVMLDPVEPTVVGRNVLEIHNYYLPKRKDTRVHAGSSFEGILENYNLRKVGGFDHFNVDENRPLRDLMEQRVFELSEAEAKAQLEAKEAE